MLCKHVNSCFYFFCLFVFVLGGSEISDIINNRLQVFLSAQKKTVWTTLHMTWHKQRKGYEFDS